MWLFFGVELYGKVFGWKKIIGVLGVRGKVKELWDDCGGFGEYWEGFCWNDVRWEYW